MCSCKLSRPLWFYLGLALVFSAGLYGGSFAASGDTLYINRHTVNVRSGPSLKTTILRHLHRGHVVIELDRKGDWVKVSLSHTEPKVGWIHASLLQLVPKQP